jgi:hypothetical protein
MRWISDFQILRFAIDHFDLANGILCASHFELDPEHANLLPLLNIRNLEADDASLAGVYPQIEPSLRSLNRHADAMECEIARVLRAEYRDESLKA